MIITFTDDDQQWHVVGTHDVQAAITAIRAEHGEQLPPEDFALAEFLWGRWVTSDHPDAAYAVDRCPKDHPEALPWIAFA